MPGSLDGMGMGSFSCSASLNEMASGAETGMMPAALSVSPASIVVCEDVVTAVPSTFCVTEAPALYTAGLPAFAGSENVPGVALIPPPEAPDGVAEGPPALIGPFVPLCDAA